MRQLTSAEKGRFVVQLDAGTSVVQVARNFHISPATVRYWRDRFREVGHVERKQGTGLHRVTTREEEDAIHDASQRQVGDSFLTARQLVARLGINVSPKTIIRRLRERGIYSRSASKKEFFTQLHRFIRNLYATTLLHLPALAYYRTIFSDEKVRKTDYLCICLYCLTRWGGVPVTS